jgi:hypothetical protein
LQEAFDRQTVALVLIVAWSLGTGFLAGLLWRSWRDYRRAIRKLTAAEQATIQSEPEQEPEKEKLTWGQKRERELFQTLAEPRTIINFQPSYLTNLCKNQTGMQIERIVPPYVGKWLRVEGLVADIRSQPDFGYVHAQAHTADDVHLSMMFPLSAFTQLEILPVGHPIVVMGRIKHFNGKSLDLEPCELLSDH